MNRYVAVVSGEDFSFQMEYASFYKGEDFALITSGFPRTSA